MSEPQSSNMENLEAILKGFDGAMAFTFSPLSDAKLPGAVPVVGIIVCVADGFITGIAGYYGDPDGKNKVPNMIGLTALQDAATAGFTVAAVLIPQGVVFTLIVATASGWLAVKIDENYPNAFEWMTRNIDELGLWDPEYDDPASRFRR
jgi:hypothetical protein